MKPIPFANQILHTGCVEGMQQLPDCCMPLTVTSPPYDDIRTYGGHVFDEATFQAVAAEIWRITVDGGVVAWVVGEQVRDGSETGTPAKQKLHFMELGFRCSTIIMVSSRVRFPEKVRYPSVFDYAFVLSKGRPRYVNILRDKRNRYAGTRHHWHKRNRDGTMLTHRSGREKPIREFGDRSNVWYYPVGGFKTATDDIEHPALMPEAMAEDLIISFSRPGELVFDPFAGGGTTCKMALLNNRRYLGMEVYEEYAIAARNRLEDARQEQKRRLDAVFFGDDPMPGPHRNEPEWKVERQPHPGRRERPSSHVWADGKEIDESLADSIPHTKCRQCGRRYPHQPNTNLGGNAHGKIPKIGCPFCDHDHA